MSDLLDHTAAGNPAMAISAMTIDVHVAELKQLFNAMDPSALDERDLDSRVEAFIVNSAKDLPRHTPLGLSVHLAQCSDDIAFLPDTVRKHFARGAGATRRRLREHFRYGRRALCIGLSFLTFTLGAVIVAEQWLNLSGLNVLKESLAIAGWVAMWRPSEIFLYDWWPILAEAKLYERLAAMPVQILSAKSAAGVSADC